MGCMKLMIAYGIGHMIGVVLVYLIYQKRDDNSD